MVKGERTIDVYIERGMADGATIEFENAADEKPDKAAGHIVFKLVTLPHARFRRQNNDLHTEMHISLLEALVGFKRTIESLDGRKVVVKKKTVTSPGDVMRVTGEGMPHHNAASKAGDLHIKFVVDFPQQLSQQQKDGFAKLL